MTFVPGPNRYLIVDRRAGSVEYGPAATTESDATTHVARLRLRDKRAGVTRDLVAYRLVEEDPLTLAGYSEELLLFSYNNW